MYRIFVSNMGEFRDSKNYEFIAEFTDRELLNQYVAWMREEKRFDGKDIIVRECAGSGLDPSEGRVACVVSVQGEYLPVADYDFT